MISSYNVAHTQPFVVCKEIKFENFNNIVEEEYDYVHVENYSDNLSIGITENVN